MKKQWLSFALVLCMMLTLLPFGASAAVVDSGTCGRDEDNLTWTLDDAGTLTISGSGNMKNFTNSRAPWDNWSVLNVVVEEGVEDLGFCAFKDCYNLERVTLPSTIQYIGPYAFD